MISVYTDQALKDPRGIHPFADQTQIFLTCNQIPWNAVWSNLEFKFIRLPVNSLSKGKISSGNSYVVKNSASFQATTWSICLSHRPSNGTFPLYPRRTSIATVWNAAGWTPCFTKMGSQDRIGSMKNFTGPFQALLMGNFKRHLLRP